MDEGREKIEINSQQQRTEDDAATMERKEQEITAVSRPVGVITLCFFQDCTLKEM